MRSWSTIQGVAQAGALALWTFSTATISATPLRPEQPSLVALRLDYAAPPPMTTYRGSYRHRERPKHRRERSPASDWSRESRSSSDGGGRRYVRRRGRSRNRDDGRSRLRRRHGRSYSYSYSHSASPSPSRSVVSLNHKKSGLSGDGSRSDASSASAPAGEAQSSQEGDDAAAASKERDYRDDSAEIADGVVATSPAPETHMTATF